MDGFDESQPQAYCFYDKCLRDVVRDCKSCLDLISQLNIIAKSLIPVLPPTLLPPVCISLGTPRATSCDFTASRFRVYKKRMALVSPTVSLPARCYFLPDCSLLTFYISVVMMGAAHRTTSIIITRTSTKSTGYIPGNRSDMHASSKSNDLLWLLRRGSSATDIPGYQIC